MNYNYIMDSYIEMIDCIDGIKKLDDKSINMVFTSPPYNMGDDRYYKNYDDNKSNKDWLDMLFKLGKEIYRVMKDDGVFVLNISYNKNNKKGFIDIVYKYTNEIGFILQETDIWTKKGMPIPEVRNHTRDSEFLFLFSKTNDYYTNQKKGKIISTLVKVKNSDVQSDNNTVNYKEKSENISKYDTFKYNKLNNATFPVGLPLHYIINYSKVGDVILDPFMGTGTTAIACVRKNMKYIGFENDEETYNKSLIRIKNDSYIDTSVDSLIPDIDNSNYESK